VAEGGGEGKATDGRSGTRDVFISYASQDTAAANTVVQALERRGIACWIAPRDVTPGTFYADEIVHAIDVAKALVLILSKNAAGSPHVLREVERASAKRHAVISLRIDQSPLPAGLEYFLNTSQWLEASGGDAVHAMPKLVAAVQLAIEKPATSGPANSSAPIAVTIAPLSSPTGGGRSSRRIAILAASTVVAGIAGFTAYRFWRLEHQTALDAAHTVAGATPAPGAAALSLSKKSVAVLPFENLSGRPEDAYLADGLQEEILNALARLRDLKVISRTSVLAFRDNRSNVREIGERLGVGSILEGSIRRDGNTLRLTVQLIDAREDRHLLAANYDRDLGHVLNLQSTVARQVAVVLAATLTRYEHGELDRVTTNNGDAYNLYLRAVALFQRPAPSDESGLIEPKRLLEEALRLDPDYADAYALLSQADTWIYQDSRRPEEGAQAKQAFERAFMIDPQLPEAQLARGLYAMYVTEDLDEAIDDLESVIRLRPNSAAARAALANALRRHGRMAEALEQYMRATDLDPLNHGISLGPLTTLLGLRRFPEAIAQANLHAQRFHDDVFIVRARIESYLLHSAEPLRAILRDHSNLLQPTERNALEAEIAGTEGRYLDAVRLLERIPSTDPLARADQLGFLYQAAGDRIHAAQRFRSVERDIRSMQTRGPVSTDTLVRLALAQSMLAEHGAALETIESARRQDPVERDATNGPRVAFAHSVILVRAGRSAEGYEEVTRLLRVPFGAPTDFLDNVPDVLLVLRGDPHFDVLINHPPRL
jgi:TolB-like protein